MEEFEAVFRDIQSNPQIQAAVLISGKPGCFVAGADINMLQSLKSAEEVTKISRDAQKIMNEIEESQKPFIAAIQGSCLGGGLELALACHYRIAVKDKKTSLGLPEVMLGLLPGGGGTQRVPKLAGVPTALDLELTGKNVRADKAKKLGIVDLLVEPLGPGLDFPQARTVQYLEEVAVGIARDLAAGKLKVDRSKKSLTDKILGYALQVNWVRDQIFGKAKKQVLKMTNGLYPAPLKVISFTTIL